MRPSSTAEVFAALGDSHRQQLLVTLARDGVASASSLASSLNVSRQAVDRHLRVLSGVGRLEPRRSGREVLYSLRRAQLDRSADWLRELADSWDRRLSTIKTAAEGPL